MGALQTTAKSIGHQHLQNLIAGLDPPGIISATSLVGRSVTGKTVISFENEEQASRWAKQHPHHQIAWFRQTIIEEEVQINI